MMAGITTGSSGSRSKGSENPEAEPASTNLTRQTRQTGEVKWFNAAKGFGFIVADDGVDVFVHFSVIQMEGYKNLEHLVGTRLEYEFVEKAPGVRQATKVYVPDLSTRHAA